MAEEFYVLQYHIYALALDLYLRTRIPDYDYGRHFGGVFYIFLRGVSAEHGPRYGIYRAKPSRGVDRIASRAPAGGREVLKSATKDGKKQNACELAARRPAGKARSDERIRPLWENFLRWTFSLPSSWKTSPGGIREVFGLLHWPAACGRMGIFVSIFASPGRYTPGHQPAGGIAGLRKSTFGWRPCGQPRGRRSR